MVGVTLFEILTLIMLILISIQLHTVNANIASQHKTLKTMYYRDRIKKELKA